MEKSEISLYSLSFETTKNYDTNLKTLIELINGCKENSVIVAPEVSLTGFDYDNLEDATNFASIAITNLKKISANKVIILTILEKKMARYTTLQKFFTTAKLSMNKQKLNSFNLVMNISSCMQVMKMRSKSLMLLV